MSTRECHLSISQEKLSEILKKLAVDPVFKEAMQSVFDEEKVQKRSKSLSDDKTVDSCGSIAELRIMSGLTQSILAKKIGVPLRTVQRYENNEVNIKKIPMSYGLTMLSEILVRINTPEAAKYYEAVKTTHELLEHLIGKKE